MSEQEGKQRYTWLGPLASTTWTNTTSNWCVLVGMDAESAFSTAGNILAVSVAGNNIDSIEIEAFGVAASEILIFLPKKMLVPPSGVVTVNNAAYLSVIVCYEYHGKTSLENALAIL